MGDANRSEADNKHGFEVLHRGLGYVSEKAYEDFLTATREC